MSESVKNIYRRIESIDFLRGLVMVIMLLDHTREYVHGEAFRFNPTDLSKTNVALFFTRWITHLCAPTFVFLSGTSIYLQRLRGKSSAELSRFLLTRGVWLIVLEFTIIRFAIFFNVDYAFVGLAEVIWAFGVSMIILAGLIFLPVRAVAAIGIAMIALHNLFDGFTVPPAVSMAGTPAPDIWQKLWMLLHQPGFVPVFGDAKIFVAYPIIPWVGLRLGRGAATQIFVPAWIRIARTFRRRSRGEFLRRPANLDGAADADFYRSLFSQHDEISGVSAVFADDSRRGASYFGLERQNRRRGRT